MTIKEETMKVKIDRDNYFKFYEFFLRRNKGQNIKNALLNNYCDHLMKEFERGGKQIKKVHCDFSSLNENEQDIMSILIKRFGNRK